MQFTLKQLTVFKSIAQTGSTVAAAEALSLSQSAISSSLQQLEEIIDQKLFDRVGRNLKLNRMGLSVLPAALSLLDHASQVDGQLKGTSVSGNIVVGASFTIANHVIVDAMVDFRRAYPDVNVQIMSDNSPGVIDAVIRGEVDFGLIESEINDPSIVCLPWLEDELVVFASPKHQLANSRLVSRTDLERESWVLREVGSGARTVFNETFSGTINNINIGMEFRHNEPIKRAVAKGVGIGCLSSRVLERELLDGTLIALKTTAETKMPRRLNLIRRTKAALPLAAMAFWDQCLEMRASAQYDPATFDFKGS